MSTSEPAQYGVLLSHASSEVYEDLIGPTQDTVADAAREGHKLARATGAKYRTVVRFGPGSEWRTIGDCLPPVEALRLGIESGFDRWMP